MAATVRSACLEPVVPLLVQSVGVYALVHQAAEDDRGGRWSSRDPGRVRRPLLARRALAGAVPFDGSTQSVNLAVDTDSHPH